MPEHEGGQQDKANLSTRVDTQASGKETKKAKKLSKKELKALKAKQEKESQEV